MKNNMLQKIATNMDDKNIVEVCGSRNSIASSKPRKEEENSCSSTLNLHISLKLTPNPQALVRGSDATNL